MRLGLDRIDIALIHDPDDHWQAALDGAYPALARLREEGVIRAVGAGMNQSEMLTRFVRETDIDVVLLAGRYTILDQGALDELLPACLERGVGVFAAGVMNSGVLANPGAEQPLQLHAGAAGDRRAGEADRRGLRPPRRAAPCGGRPVRDGPSRDDGARHRRPDARPSRGVPGARRAGDPGRLVGGAPRRGPHPARRPDARLRKRP